MVWGGRWLMAGFRAGHLLAFTSQRIRLSADARYQPASVPIDERWIGEGSIGHGRARKPGWIY